MCRAMRLSSLLWLILMAAVCISWWKHRQSRGERIEQLRSEIEVLEKSEAFTNPPIITY